MTWLLSFFSLAFRILLHINYATRRDSDMVIRYDTGTTASDKAPDMDNTCDAAADSSASEDEDPLSVICEAAIPATWSLLVLRSVHSFSLRQQFVKGVRSE